jgi:hypothetical protein
MTASTKLEAPLGTSLKSLIKGFVLRIRTTIYYEYDSPRDGSLGFKGYIPDNVRQVLKGANEQIKKALGNRNDY